MSRQRRKPATSTSPARVSAGVREGGQFSTTARTEPEVSLPAAAPSVVPGSLRAQAITAAASGKPLSIDAKQVTTGDRLCPDGKGAGFEVMSVWERQDGSVEVEYDDPANPDELSVWNATAGETASVRILGNTSRCPACGAQHEGPCAA